MELSELLPSKGIDLDSLKVLFDEKDWEACLPTTLPESVLLSLARDFRRVEASSVGNSTSSEEDASSLAVAIFAVLSLISKHPTQKSLKNRFEMSEEGMFRAVKLYQIGIEREIVSRITGVVSSYPEEQLTEDLLKCIE